MFRVPVTFSLEYVNDAFDWLRGRPPYWKLDFPNEYLSDYPHQKIRERFGRSMEELWKNSNIDHCILPQDLKSQRSIMEDYMNRTWDNVRSLEMEEYRSKVGNALREFHFIKLEHNARQTYLRKGEAQATDIKERLEKIHARQSSRRR